MAPSESAETRFPPRTVLIWATGAALAGMLGTAVLAPAPPDTSATNGDADLAAAVADHLPEDSAVGVSVAVLDGEEVTQATLGTTDGRTPVEPDSPFETGSVQKTLTATLLADMVRTGEVQLDTTLDEVWSGIDFADDNVAGITLEQLATHHSGLPEMPNNAGNLGGVLLHNYFGTDPYRWVADPVEHAAELTDSGPDSDTGYAYSNLGYALLGQSLAEVAGDDYPTVLTERVLDPLGMSDTTLLTSPEVPANGAHPYRTPMIRVQPSFNPANAPAGVGTWTTSGDMVKLLQAAMAQQDVPDLATAQEPRARGDVDSDHDERVGLAWVRWNVNDTEVTWHNGGTAGSRSFVAHTDDGRGVVVLANSTLVPVETIGLRLLDPDMPEVDSASPVPPLATYFAYALGVGVPILMLVRTGRTGTAQRSRLDRVGAAGGLLFAAALWVLSFRIGAPDHIPALWALGGGTLAAATVLGVWRWHGLPLTRGDRPWKRWVDFAVYLVLTAAIVAGLAAALG